MTFYFLLSVIHGSLIGLFTVIACIAKCRLDGMEMGVDLDVFQWAGAKTSLVCIGLFLGTMLSFALLVKGLAHDEKNMLLLAFLAIAAVCTVAGFWLLRKLYPSKDRGK